jgi:DNA-binding NtrC family response regulator
MAAAMGGDALRLVTEVARSERAVLVVGRSQAAVAREIHRYSPRSERPLIAVSCAAIQTNVDGLIRAAHGGTLFLDEVGVLPSDAQASLLETLSTADVRVISATTNDLEAAVAEGTFSADLFSRLSEITLRLPLPTIAETVAALKLYEVPFAEAKRRVVAEFTEAYVAQILAAAGNNVSEAARRSGLDRSNFRRLSKK